MKLKVNCGYCKKEYSFVVNGDDYRRWRREPVMAKDAMPYLTEEQLSLLQSNICDKCQYLLFNKEDDGIFDI